MFTKEQIINVINESGHFIDLFILDAFIKNYKIESIYEDENGVEFFDETGVEKIKNGIINKIKPVQETIVQEPLEESMVQEIHPEHSIAENKKTFYEVTEKEFDEKNDNNIENTLMTEHVVEQIQQEPKEQSQIEETKNFTLDITNKTLATVANSIAKKIISEISDYLKQSNFFEDEMKLTSLKNDNKILVNKLDEVMKDNKVLVKKIQKLEDEKTADYLKIFGNIYIKK